MRHQPSPLQLKHSVEDKAYELGVNAAVSCLIGEHIYKLITKHYECTTNDYLGKHPFGQS